MCFPSLETHIPSDMCSPSWETHTPSDMCSSTWKSHIPSDMCSRTRETHIPSDMCSTTWETHIPCDMTLCSPTRETFHSFAVVLSGLSLRFHVAGFGQLVGGNSTVTVKLKKP